MTRLEKVMFTADRLSVPYLPGTTLVGGESGP